jgi:hypothetical protein
LGTGVDDTVLAPVNGARAEVRRHITDNDLAFGNCFKWEIVELKALNSLIVTKVEIRSVVLNLPIS